MVSKHFKNKGNPELQGFQIVHLAFLYFVLSSYPWKFNKKVKFEQERILVEPGMVGKTILNITKLYLLVALSSYDKSMMKEGR